MTLSENVQRVVELSQRIVVEKTVINQYEQVQNQTKKSEISIENSKRVVLSDNNSSSTSMVVEKSREKLTESNGMVQNCERFSGKECTIENNVNGEHSENVTKLPKSSSSCNDLLIFCQSQGKPKPEMEQTASVADFAIPYNIINNYFSGLFTSSWNASALCLLKIKVLQHFVYNIKKKNRLCSFLYLQLASMRLFVWSFIWNERKIRTNSTLAWRTSSGILSMRQVKHSRQHVRTCTILLSWLAMACSWISTVFHCKELHCLIFPTHMAVQICGARTYRKKD